MTNPVHALPLGVADAHKDITRDADSNSQVNVGYSSLAAPSSIIGYARLGGGEPVSFPAGKVDATFYSTLARFSPAAFKTQV